MRDSRNSSEASQTPAMQSPRTTAGGGGGGGVFSFAWKKGM